MNRASRQIPMAVLVGLAFVLLALDPGCGPGEPDVDKAARYTPESLAQELSFRYRALTPEARKASTRPRVRARSARTIAQAETSEKLLKKGGEITATKKRSGPPTLDDLLDDIDSKLGLLQGVSRPDACRKMTETIAQDGALTEDDKKLLSTKLKELSDAS